MKTALSLWLILPLLSCPCTCNTSQHNTNKCNTAKVRLRELMNALAGGAPHCVPPCELTQRGPYSPMFA